MTFNLSFFMERYKKIENTCNVCPLFIHARCACIIISGIYFEVWVNQRCLVSCHYSFICLRQKFFKFVQPPRVKNWISNIWWVCVIFKYVWKHFQWETIKELTFVCGRYFDSKRKANPFACLDHTLSCSEHIFLIGDGFDPFEVLCS